MPPSAEPTTDWATKVPAAQPRTAPDAARSAPPPAELATDEATAEENSLTRDKPCAKHATISGADDGLGKRRQETAKLRTPSEHPRSCARHATIGWTDDGLSN
jgi:hypothetical protein